MPIDPSVLLGARGIDVPNPLQLAGQGLSLADLFGKTQLQGLQLQQARDLAGYYAQALGGGNGAGPFGIDQDALQAHPMAAQSVIPMALGFQEKQSQIAKNTADARKAAIDAQNVQLKQVQSFADALGDSPTLPQAQALFKWVTNAGLDPNTFEGSDPASFAKSVARRLQDPEQRAKIAKDTIEAQQAPAKLAVEQSRAQTSQQELALRQAEFYGGKAVQDQDTKEWSVQVPKQGGGWMVVPASGGGTPARPGPIGAPASDAAMAADTAPLTPAQQAMQAADNSGQSAPATSSAYPAGPSGAPKTGPNLFEKKLQESGAEELKNMVAASQAAAQTKEFLTDLRSTEAKGMFSGGVKGTEWYRNLANVMAPFLSPEDKAKLANTQAWTADTGNLVAQAVKQFVGSGGRVAAREIDFFRGVKPEAVQTAEGRAQIYANIWRMADKLQQAPELATKHVQDTQDYGLTSFRPKFNDTPLPPLKVDTLNGVAPTKGRTATADDGTKYVGDGTQWVRQK